MIEKCSKCEQVAIVQMTTVHLNAPDNEWFIRLCVEHFIEFMQALGVDTSDIAVA